MTAIHLLLRVAHIAAGVVGLLSGAAAMLVTKGTRSHARVGHVFFGSMVVMATAGTILSIVPDVDRLNITGGSLTLYLVVSAWLTVRRPAGQVGRAEVVTAVAGLGAVLLMLSFAMRAGGIAADSGALPFFLAFASILALGVLGDLRWIARGGGRGRVRTRRHLWRMCTAMLIATLSLFLGQPQVFPPMLRDLGVLPLPPLAVLLALAWFAIRESDWFRAQRSP